MKKIFIAILCMLLVMSLCACDSYEPSAYKIHRNGTDYVVDRVSQKISDGTHTYRYSISGDSDSYSIGITYPDGSTYSWSVRSSGSGASYGYGGWSSDYDASRYVSGETLCDILEAEVPEKKEQKNILLILGLLALGIFNTVSPHTAWYLEYGWRYKDAEPSDLALSCNRFGGVAAIAVAVIMMFV